MSNIRTSVTIAASPERVWQVLTDFDAYGQWNTVIPRIRAEARVGALARFRIRLGGPPEIPFTARVVRCEPRREFAWRGGAPLVPSIAWGEHWFRIEPSGEGVLFTHGEDFGGLLALVMNGGMHRRVTRAYDSMNNELKARAEATTA